MRIEFEHQGLKLAVESQDNDSCYSPNPAEGKNALIYMMCELVAKFRPEWSRKP